MALTPPPRNVLPHLTPSDIAFWNGVGGVAAGVVAGSGVALIINGAAEMIEHEPENSLVTNWTIVKVGCANLVRAAGAFAGGWLVKLAFAGGLSVFLTLGSFTTGAVITGALIGGIFYSLKRCASKSAEQDVLHQIANKVATTNTVTTDYVEQILASLQYFSPASACEFIDTTVTDMMNTDDLNQIDEKLKPIRFAKRKLQRRMCKKH